MSKQLNWESECRPRIKYLHERGDTALCVLWNLLDPTLERLGELPEYLRLAGNLRTPLGISWFLRGLWLHPEIKRVALWGTDYTRTGEALLRLWEEGPTEQHTVPGFGWKLDPYVGYEAIGRLIVGVELYDFRESSADDLAAGLHGLYAPWNVSRVRREFPPVEVPDDPALPWRGSGLHLQAAGIEEAWLKLLNALGRYGSKRGTRKTEEIRHLFQISVTFPIPAREEIPASFDLSAADLEAYWPQMLDDAPPPPGVDYRYGQRLQNWPFALRGLGVGHEVDYAHLHVVVQISDHSLPPSQ